MVKEVIINRMTEKSPPGFKVLSIDSGLIADYNVKSLADLLTENSTVFVKSYGSGGLANPSLRGTGPGHTIISWNDLILNNPMLGQFDMSLIPAGFVDKIDILPGGGSMDISEGGLGGIINLETKADWEKRTLISESFRCQFWQFYRSCKNKYRKFIFSVCYQGINQSCTK